MPGQKEYFHDKQGQYSLFLLFLSFFLISFCF